MGCAQRFPKAGAWCPQTWKEMDGFLNPEMVNIFEAGSPTQNGSTLFYLDPFEAGYLKPHTKFEKQSRVATRLLHGRFGNNKSLGFTKFKDSRLRTDHQSVTAGRIFSSSMSGGGWVLESSIWDVRLMKLPGDRVGT